MVRRISFWGDFRDPKYEGMNTIIGMLQRFLEKEGFIVTRTSKDADIIHIHSNGIAQSFQVKELKKTGAKLIYSIYTDFNMDPGTYIRTWKDEILHNPSHIPLRRVLGSISAITPLAIKRHNLRFFDKVIVPFDYMKVKLYPNTITIAVGIDTQRFRMDRRKGGKIVVAYFGPFSASKGILEFMDLARDLPSDYAVHLYIRNLNQRIKNQIMKTCPRALVFGYVKDIVSAYNRTDIVVLPYRSSMAGIAAPLVLLEAMSCGCTVITTDFPNYRKIVGKEGIIVRSTDEIGKNIFSLGRKEIAALGKKARDRIVKDYNESKMFKSVLEVYRGLG